MFKLKMVMVIKKKTGEMPFQKLGYGCRLQMKNNNHHL